jgi:DNA-binding Lrp family transcriptional regulator
MSVNDIAENIRVSPKTVRNHLNTIIEKGIITLQVIANQADSGNFVPFIQIYLEKGKDKNEVIHYLRGNLFPPLVETNNYSNHLDMFTAYGWIQNMGQLRDLVAGIGKADGVRAVVPNVFVESRSQCTWLSKLLDDPEKTMSFLQERKII